MGKRYEFTEDEIKDMVDMYLNQLQGVYNIAKKYGVDETLKIQQNIIKIKNIRQNIKMNLFIM